MHVRSFKCCMICCLLIVCQAIHAQKDIVLSDSFTANADKLPVKMGSQGPGKMWKLRFGEYTTITSKAGWTTTSTKGNLFNTKTESISKQKFSFVLGDKTNEANVNAARNVSTDMWHGLDLFPNILGSTDVTLKDSSNFTAFITINGDTTAIWALLVSMVSGAGTGSNYQAILSDGQRKITIYPASSNKNGEDKRSLPALGYEFVENGTTIAALQYFGGGMFGTNKNIVWLSKALDEKFRLLLAAASAAILQANAPSAVI